MLSAKQTPKDGIGQEKTLYGQGVRLKAKNLTKVSSTTLKITGMTSGAVHYVDIVVKNGTPARFSSPSVTPPGGQRQERQEQRREQGREERQEQGREERQREGRPR